MTAAAVAGQRTRNDDNRRVTMKQPPAETPPLAAETNYAPAESLALGQLLSHVQEQAPVGFLDLAEETPEAVEEASFLPAVSPDDLV